MRKFARFVLVSMPSAFLVLGRGTMLFGPSLVVKSCKTSSLEWLGLERSRSVGQGYD